jgi:DNA-binding LytR/AlgR family response regulator
MKTILVDDEIYNMEAFEMEIQGIDDIEIVGRFRNPEEAFEYARNNPVDLAVLDVEMPEMNGITLGEKLRECQPNILLIYITAYKQYAFDAFQLNAVSYLLKPFNRRDIENAIDRAEKLAGNEPLFGSGGRKVIRRMAICDDNKEDRTLLHNEMQKYLSEHNATVEIVEYSDGRPFLADQEEGFERFDLIFMSVNMEAISGIDIAHKIRQAGINVPIVFITVSPEYAVESYDVNASGYLLKPLDVEKLHALLSRLMNTEDRPRIALRCKGRKRYFFIDEILWIESFKHMLFLHLLDGSTVQTNQKLNSMEAELNDTRFLRCHQSYLINMDWVADAQDVFIMKDGSRVPIRVRTHKAIVEHYYQYFMQHSNRKTLIQNG